MKIFSSDQIRAIDEFTIRTEPLSPAGLMERASGQLFSWISSHTLPNGRILIFAGPGNNGGDGLALARLLYNARYDVSVYYVSFSDKRSPEWEINHKRLENETSVVFREITSADDFPLLNKDDIIIDAIFGSGLTRPACGLPAEIISLINNSEARVISIDIPSGLFCEDNGSNNCSNIVNADYTLSFHFPKLAFMFSENYRCVGEWTVLPIGLSPEIINKTVTPFRYIENGDVFKLLKKRSKFDHKGSFGHSFLISGSYGKMGASLLAASAALRTGTGLLTCHIPSCGYVVMQGSLPEAMVISDRNENRISDIGETSSYSAVGAGPGMGTGTESQEAIRRLLSECRKPLVLDADALNIISLNKEWLSIIPQGTILTPHPKEFERLTAKTANSYERLMLQRKFATDHNCIVIVKGANSSVALPDGTLWFNSTGNPGMATAGSGDVLTGIILSLLAQGYSSEDAALTGVYLHGLAGDIAAGESCQESITASDIILSLGKAFNMIRNS